MNFVKTYKTTATFALSLMAVLGVMTTSAQATLIGDQVNCDIDPAPYWTCDNPSAIVDASPEFELALNNNLYFNVDLGASSVTLNYMNPFGISIGAFELVTLSDLDWIGMVGDIVGISNFVSTATSGMDASDVTFTANSVMIDLHVSMWHADQSLSFDLVTRHTNDVPEPATLALLGLGLMGIGFARRRRT